MPCLTYVKSEDVFGSDATRPASGPSSGKVAASVLVDILNSSHSNIALVHIITTSAGGRPMRAPVPGRI